MLHTVHTGFNMVLKMVIFHYLNSTQSCLTLELALKQMDINRLKQVQLILDDKC